MTAGYAAKPGLLRSAFKHLFSARKSDWEKFDGIFDAFWLGSGVRSRSMTDGLVEGGEQSVAARRLATASAPAATTAMDQVHPPTTAATIAPAKAAWKAPRAPTIWPRSDFRKIADPAQIEQAHAAAARLARAMRTRLTRRDLARRRGYRLDLRRTIHGNISHGGVPIDLVRRQRKDKPLRLVMLLDASGSMSIYTGVFLRFIHGVLDAVSRGRGLPLPHPARPCLRRDEGEATPRARSTGSR